MIVGLLLTANSCRKDSSSLKQNSPDFLAEAKEAFTDQIAIDQNYQLLSPSSKKSFRHGLSKSPDWKNANVVNLKKGKAVLVPIIYDKEIFLKVNNKKNNYISLKNLSYLLIYNSKGKGKTIEWVTFMPDNDSYRNDGNKFTGKVVIEDWAGNFKKGYMYDKEGKIFTLINQNGNADSPKVQSNGIKVNDVYCVSTPWYAENFFEGESLGLYIGGYDMSCFNTGSIYAQDEKVNYPNDDGGFTRETFPDDYVPFTTIIVNNVNDPCLKKMVQYSIDKNIQINIKESVNSIFNINDDFDLVYEDNYSLPDSIDGETSVISYGFSPNRLASSRTMSIKIGLNSKKLPNSSKEYITATILHEALHAYFRYTGTILDHNNMADNYLNWFKVSVKNIYPNMSDSDAEFLGWRGLSETWRWQNTLDKNIQDNIIDINKRYKDGTNGTKCI